MSRRTRLVLVAGAVVALIIPVAAIASDRFVDVPDDNVFHDDIGWLADARVTIGCNPPVNDEYCPSDFVTRQQMAAFMRRLAENQVVDAATVEGLGIDEMTSRAAFNSTNDLPDEEAALEVEIEAPGRGTLVINGSARVFRNAENLDTAECRLRVNDVEVTGSLMFVDVGIAETPGVGDFEPTASVRQPCGTTGSVVVDEGSHTVEFHIASAGGFANTVFQAGSVNVVWVPLDGGGSQPAEVAGQYTFESAEPADG